MGHEAPLKEALSRLRYAQHLIHLAEDVVGDPKMLLGALEHLHTAYLYAIHAFLSGLHPQGDTSFPLGIEDAFRRFRTHSVSPAEAAQEHCEVVRKLRDLIMAHANSSVEFARGGQYVICSDDYEMTVLTPSKLRYFVDKGKLFIQQIRRQVENE